MTYYIIQKIELIAGSISYTPVGYLTSKEDVDSATEICNCFLTWCSDNAEDLASGVINVSEHFAVHGKSYAFTTTTNYIDDLPLITDTSTLI